ncbi:MAG: aldehyde dehydrogenase [Oscillospiraceae bacterium]|jgi:aldehyde dehydrogenase (NAD+)|nr:aldehyde dehydrogenase [Oscillospiraceae bacterium]
MTAVELQTVTERQRTFFADGGTRDIKTRVSSLAALRREILSRESEILTALLLDLGKSAFEAYATEIGIVLDEIKYALRHIYKWSADKRVPSPLKQFPSHSFIRPEPYGSVLIMSPWNYPFQLTLAPLIGAVAAGNCVIVKPSAYSPATSAVIQKILGSVFAPEHVFAALGGREENALLLSHKFDYIFFTGSVAVGKTVMAAAAANLTPVTLELGGKSPCIVDDTADIALAARRIVWGKFVNAGQTCVAPDYLLVHKSVKRALIGEMTACIERFFGENPLTSDHLCKMINEKHFDRVRRLIDGENVAVGGDCNVAALKIAPTLLDSVDWNAPVMQDEIFGPVMPVVEFDDLADALDNVRARPHPLALYIFTRSKRNERLALNSVSFGGGCVNDTLVHLATSHMPFGGVGDSGTGGYHGKAGFDTFTHRKSIMKKSLLLDMPFRYPPYKDSALRLLKKL